MKSEAGDEIISEFVALSPKSYAYKYCETRREQSERGITFSFWETMDAQDHKRVLDADQSQTRKLYGIRSFNLGSFEFDFR